MSSITKETVIIASRLPWWVCLIFSALSFISLHSIAGIQVEQTNIGSFVVKQFLVTMALFGQIVSPILFVFSAIISSIRKYVKIWPEKYIKITIAAGIFLTVVILIISRPSKQEEKNGLSKEAK